MPNFAALYNRFVRISSELKNHLENDLPSVDETEFNQVFGKKLENNLSAHGKSIYAEGLDQDALKAIHKQISEKLNQDYKESLASVATKLCFDTNATVNNAQKQFGLKLEKSKQALLEKLNNELAVKDQEFTNPADKKELNTAFSNYLDTLGKKYKDNLNEINSIWPELAKWKLHLRNKESEAKAKNADFILDQTDPRKLSIGIAPDPTIGWKIDTDNLVERLMHRLASQNPGEKFHITLNIPDRSGIVKQIGEISFQYRSPAVALFVVIFFYFLAIFRNNDVERMVKAFKEIIKEEGIAIDPNDISYSIKQLNTNGKWDVIKEKGPLDPKHIDSLQQANQELIKNLKEVNEVPKSTKPENSGYGSDQGYESERPSSDEEDEESINPRRTLRM